MTVSFVDNVSVQMVDVLNNSIANARDARLSVAYVSAAGVSLIREALLRCCSEEGTVEFIVGVDSFATEPDALRMLLQFQEDGQPVTCVCHGNPASGRGSIYHPKLYLLDHGEATDVIVGSSNLTDGGLRKNTELNAVMELDSGDETLDDVRGVYDHFKFASECFTPDAEFVEAYAEAAERVSRTRRREVDAVAAEGLAEVLSAKRSALRLRPPSAVELRGWQRLVYDALPEGPFQTDELYVHETWFAKEYPHNRHIRQKICEILQQLRDMGLLRHVRHGWWEPVAPRRRTRGGDGQ